MDKKLEQAFELFDDYNRQDPELVSYDGNTYPATYFYSLQLHNWIMNLMPSAGEALLLASRSQHIGRWESPRENYPAGKAGYYKWRTDLGRFHAKKAAGILSTLNYDTGIINEVKTIIRKEDIKGNEDVQAMENALCLVFLQFQYESFLEKYDDEKVIRILQRSWTKMSEPGREAATTLSFQGRAKNLLEKALQNTL